MKTVPAIKLLLFLVLGIYCGDKLPLIHPLMLWCATIALLLISIFFVKRNAGVVLVFFTVFAAGFLLGNTNDAKKLTTAEISPDLVLIGGKVQEEILDNEERRTLLFRPNWMMVEDSLAHPFMGDIRLITRRGDPDVQPGSALVLCGNVNSYSPRRNPGGRDYRTEYARKGIVGWMKPLEMVTVEPTDKSYIHSVRSSLERLIDSILPPRQAGLLTGMLLGQKNALSDDIRDKFRYSGLYHLLAVSGLHIGFFFAFLMLFVHPVSLNPRLRRSFVFLGLWGYVLLTGANPPTLRAALMISLWFLSFEFQRVPRPWNLWGAAALIVLLISPQQLFLPGFQLSFTAMAGLLMAVDIQKRIDLTAPILPLKSRKFKAFISKTILSSLLVSLFIAAFTAPVLMVHYGSFAPIAILLNILAVPLAGGIFALSWIVIFIKIITGLTPIILTEALELGIKGLEVLASTGSNLPGNANSFAGNFIIAFAFPFMVLGFIYLKSWKRRIIWCAAGVAVCLLLPFAAGNSKLIAEVLDVGQGDAFLFRFPGGKRLLIDCGGEKAARFELIPSFQRRGISRVDALLLTHFDKDHAGGAVEMMKTLKIGRLLVNDLYPGESLGRSIIATAQEKRIPIRSLALGDTICGFPGTKCLTLWPPEGKGGDDNSRSIVLKISYGDVDFLMTGDIGKSEERILLSANDYLDCEVLKIAHHGSKYASTGSFLQAVKPEIALISCGAKNPYGHPDNEVIHDLLNIGSFVHRTDGQYAGVIASNGEKTWWVDWK